MLPRGHSSTPPAGTKASRLHFPAALTCPAGLCSQIIHLTFFVTAYILIKCILRGKKMLLQNVKHFRVQIFHFFAFTY
jgi:hypothetical protein